MTNKEIENKIKENKKIIQDKRDEISSIERTILQLEKKLKEKQEENLIDFISPGDVFDVQSWVRLGLKLSFRKGDSFKVTKVNKKSLYIKILKKSSWNSIQKHFILPPEHEIYKKEIKISSRAFYNGFYREVKDIVDKTSNRNELLDEILK